MMYGTTHTYSDLIKMREYQNNGPSNSHHATWTLGVFPWYWIFFMATPMLQSNKIEDEFHLLAKCNMYDDLRKRLIPRYYKQRPPMFKVVQLIN